ESVTATSATIVAVPAATITAALVRVAAASTRRRKGLVIRDPEEESTAKIPAKTKSKDKGKGIMVEEPKPMKKKLQVEMDEEYARKLHEKLNKDIDWSVAIDHVKQKAKEGSYVQRYQVIKKMPQTEAQARRNMIMYLKNVDVFRLDYFKGMSFDDIRLIFEAKFNSNIEFLLKSKVQIEEEENRAIESINETLAQKEAKRRKLNKEDKDLKQHLEIVPDEDDDVYTEATPLARKVPVVDYQIIQLNNKPRYKIIKADGTHQLAMFERPDGQDQIWKSKRSVHGQPKLILLVKRRYPLSRFTLDQMLNAMRLRVEEESEMSLELLSESVTATSATIAAVPAATITDALVRVAAASTRRRKGLVIRDPEEESTAKIPAKTKSKDKGKGIMVEEPKPMKKKLQVEMDEEYARKLHEELNKDIDWSVAIDHVKQKAKEGSYVQRYQVIKKRPQTEAQARRNMIMYLKNVDVFRLDYFKGMSYDDIRPIFKAKFNSNIEFLLKSKVQIEEEENRAIESINETLAQKEAKRRKLNKEDEDLKQHLEIVPDEDDDVYTEATPLARKVPVVDYQIIQLNNKPRYKIIRADGTHQLYVSFITLLKNFDREDLESLWSIVKEKFSTSKPNNFSDDYLLTTLRAMFKRPDGQDQIW
nr:hypothetical protein [Tanacetum cinerariifolium]